MEKVNAQLKQWVDNWSRVGTELERLRIEEMRQSDTCESMLALSDAFDAALAEFEIPLTSGLVEQQKYFMLAGKKCSR